MHRVVLAPLLSLSLSLLSTLPAQAQSTLPAEPSAVLKRYINLRLAMADWTLFSPLITWPEEPSWDCYWVTSQFKLDDPRPGTDDVIVPATYYRLGRFCSDADLELFDESDRVDYHLVLSGGKWKVAGPLPDYPDIEIQTLLRRLANSAASSRESPERRRQLDELIRQLRVAFRAHPRMRR
jgi:hypothetical protein